MNMMPDATGEFSSAKIPFFHYITTSPPIEPPNVDPKQLKNKSAAQEL